MCTLIIIYSIPEEFINSVDLKQKVTVPCLDWNMYKRIITTYAVFRLSTCYILLYVTKDLHQMLWSFFMTHFTDLHSTQAMGILPYFLT